MELDTTLSWDNPLWPALAAILFLVATYISNKSKSPLANQSDNSRTLDQFLLLLSSTKIPFVYAFVSFIASNKAIKDQLQAIWDAFINRNNNKEK